MRQTSFLHLQKHHVLQEYIVPGRAGTSSAAASAAVVEDLKMRSDNVTKGSERAPNRSLFYALGYTKEELERPLIGVVSAHSEIVPGHMNLDKIADAVKAGVEMAGGTPILIPAIGVCDGIAMGHVGMKYSLASRELICDSVETMLMAHQLDGLVLVPNCDKIVPGMVMAAVRMDVPAVVCSGGPMLAGTYGGEEVSLSKMFEAVGAYKAGMITEDQLEDCTCNCCPSCGSCSGMYTANSMNCLCEAIVLLCRATAPSRLCIPSACSWQSTPVRPSWIWSRRASPPARSSTSAPSATL